MHSYFGHANFRALYDFLHHSIFRTIECASIAHSAGHQCSRGELIQRLKQLAGLVLTDLYAVRHTIERIVIVQ
jgi:hypothetical protein